MISLTACLFFISSYSQCPGKTDIYKKILFIERDTSASYEEKLSAFYKLKKIAETCDLPEDSVYAWIFLKLGKYEFAARDNYKSAIEFSQNALAINRSSIQGRSAILTINACFNIASAYMALLYYSKALHYFDSVIFLCKNYPDPNSFALESHSYKTSIYFSSGDYEKAVEESIKCMRLSELDGDLYQYTYFLNMKAQSLCFENNIQDGLNDALKAVVMAKKIKSLNELATAYKTLAMLYQKNNLVDSAKYYFMKAINTRSKTGDYQNLGNDYNDFGGFYLDVLKDYKNAENCYKDFFLYADKINNPIDRAVKKAAANLNLGENYFQQDNLKEAEKYYLRSFNALQLNLSSIQQNPPAAKLVNFSSNTDLIIVLLNNKLKLLLQLYKTTKRTEFLNACLQSSFVADSVITQIRHEKYGEQSKLYWRNKTNAYFNIAIEASYLSGNPGYAFYFMEKSRAVLLNDKLNELGAVSYLPPSEIAIQEDYQNKIIRLEQQLSVLSDSSASYQNIQIQLFTVKENFDNYITSLEKKYPAYYQYKYADKVPSVKDLQFYLAKNNQSFVDYFLGDTATYILAITPTNTILKRLAQNEFDKEQLVQFLQMCAKKEALNSHYNLFAKLSNSIYKKIFQPLQLPKGRIIICSDNIVIPFDALCTDAAGKNFLLNDYVFSYVYSARFLMKHFTNAKAEGNFAGFAPVSFDSSLHAADLKNAADALHASAAYYKKNRLFTYGNASRSNFFNYAASYSIVSVFSHARADTTDNEPVLFMQDSVIHLSELQLLNDPATKLVLLSACQTNVGRAAAGEGVYSLARGFATAGIPSVAATLWKADEQTIYVISEKFNEYLSGGMTKDEALQKAKLYFIQNNSNNEKLLPYYWANMIVIGNTDPIKLIHDPSNLTWRIIAAVVLLMLTFVFIYTKKKSSNKKR